MAEDLTMTGARRIAGVGSIEHELTMHIEKACELGERAKRSNGALQVQLDRAREIAAGLKERLFGGDLEE